MLVTVGELERVDTRRERRHHVFGSDLLVAARAGTRAVEALPAGAHVALLVQLYRSVPRRVGVVGDRVDDGVVAGVAVVVVGVVAVVVVVVVVVVGVCMLL